jgi:hypothetical protein
MSTSENINHCTTFSSTRLPLSGGAKDKKAYQAKPQDVI